MKPRIVLALLALVGLIGSVQGAAEENYASLVASAKQLGAENSWGRAREAYARALEIAPDAAAHLWCRLWIADATWRSDGEGTDPGVRYARYERHLAALDVLLTESPENQPRDDFWVAAMESRADLRDVNHNDGWKDRVAIADALVLAPLDEAARARYLAYLQKPWPEIDQSVQRDLSRRWLEHLARGARLAPTSNERATRAIRVAELGAKTKGMEPAEQRERWAWARSMARDTAWEANARAGEFLWRAYHLGWAADGGRGTEADLRRLLDELEDVRRGLRARDAAPVQTLDDELTQLRTLWQSRWLEAEIPEILRPDQPMQFSHGSVGCREIIVSIHRLSAEQWQEDLHWPRRGKTKRDVWRDAPRIREWKIAVPFTDKLEWRSEIAEISPALPPGAYTIVLDGEPRPNHDRVTRTFVVSSVQAFSITPNHGSGQLLFFDAETGKPVGGAVVQGAIVEREKSTPWTGTTDASGLVTIEPPKGDGGYRSLELQALVGDHPIRVPISERRTQKPSLVADLFLPRALYRPGETVPWKLILRERQAGQFVVPGHKLIVGIRLGEEQLMPETTVALSEFGTVTGELMLPSSVRPGWALMSVAADGAAAPNLSWSTSMFRVENVVPPALTIETQLASDADSLRPGRTLVIRAQLSYYSGGPAVGTPVTANFRAALPWSRETEPSVRKRFEQWVKEISEQTQSATTDGKGAAEFRLELPEALPDGTSLECVNAAVPDGGQSVRSGLNLMVRETGAAVDPREQGMTRLVAPNRPETFAGRVLDGANRPRALVGTARLVERRWVETWLDPAGVIRSGDEAPAARRPAGLLAGDKLPVPWQKVFAGEVDRVIAEKEMRTADGNFAIEFTPPGEGRYRVELVRDGAVLPSATYGSADSMLAVVAADDSTKSLAFAPDTSVLLGAEAVAADEPLRFLVVPPEGPRVGWIVVQGEEQAVVQRFETAGRAGFVTIATPPPFSMRGSARLVFPETNRWEDGRANFRVEHPGQKLTVALTAEQSELRPGAESALHVKVSDEHGAPVRAELAAAGADEAWNDLVGERRERATKTAFADFSRSVNTSIDWSHKNSRTVERISDPRPGARSLELSEQWLSIPAMANASYMMAPSSLIVRRHFDATAFWTAGIVTDANGEARVPFKYPDSLSEWRLAAYAVGPDGESFGRASATTRTTLPLQARLQAPRFLVAGDTTEPSALLLNRTAENLTVTATLNVEGASVNMDATQAEHSSIVVPAAGETRVHWTMRAENSGEASLTLTARATDEGDAMAVSFPVREDGIEQDTSASDVMRGDTPIQTMELPLPDPLDPARTKVVVELSPSRAAVLLDALPYLVLYPYGCVEQTMNRFLPAVVVKKTLTDFGLDAEAVEQRILGREIAADVRRREGTAGLNHLDDVVARGVARLNDAQRDFGFGWWPDARQGDLWMTAYVAWGLALAQDSGIALPRKLLADTRRALTQQISATDKTGDRFAWALAALASGDGNDKGVRENFARVYAARGELSAAGRASLALAAVKFGTDEQRAVLLRNLENGAQRVKADDLGDTVHWGATGNYFRAMDGAVESTALTLLALLELDPKHPLIEPAANWLVLNRRSAHWTSTRDTAFAILALTKYIATRGELDADAEIDVLANGKQVQRVKFARESLLAGDTTIAIDPKLLRAGANTIELRRVGGKSPVYAVALASSWARGDAVQPQGHLINVARGFVRQKQEPTLLGTLRITPEPLPADGKANAAIAGEQVTARVTLNVPNELEYVMVEVPKPAGCEPLNPLSGYDATLRRVTEAASAWRADLRVGRENGSDGAGPSMSADDGTPIYREEHDDKSVFFIDSLAAGAWEIRFALRATTPGDYRALPVEASAMYVPEVRANSDAQRVRIERREN